MENKKNNEIKVSPIFIKLEVTLYEYIDSSFNINSYAYFEEEDLVIDYWKLASRYEDEYFVTIKGNDLKLLYRKLEIQPNSKSELLKKISDIFKGPDCFDNVKLFLNKNQILFESRVLHDER